MNTPLDDPASIAAIWQLNRHQDIQDTATANGPQGSEEPPAVEQQPTQAAAPAQDEVTEATTGPSSDSETSTPEPGNQPREAGQARGPPRRAHTGRQAVLSM